MCCPPIRWSGLRVGQWKRRTDEATRISFCGELKEVPHKAAGAKWLGGQTVRLPTAHFDFTQPLQRNCIDCRAVTSGRRCVGVGQGLVSAHKICQALKLVGHGYLMQRRPAPRAWLGWQLATSIATSVGGGENEHSAARNARAQQAEIEQLSSKGQAQRAERTRRLLSHPASTHPTPLCRRASSRCSSCVNMQRRSIRRLTCQASKQPLNHTGLCRAAGPRCWLEVGRHASSHHGQTCMPLS